MIFYYYNDFTYKKPNRSQYKSKLKKTCIMQAIKVRTFTVDIRLQTLLLQLAQAKHPYGT